MFGQTIQEHSQQCDGCLTGTWPICVLDSVVRSSSQPIQCERQEMGISIVDDHHVFGHIHLFGTVSSHRCHFSG